MTTEEKIQKAFLSLMQQTSYTDITVTALAEKAGINRRTFYRHYSSIASVLTEFECNTVKTYCEMLTGRPFSIRRFIEAINQNIRNYYDFFDDLAVTQKHSFFIEHFIDIIAYVFDAALQRPAEVSPAEFNMHIRFVAGGMMRVYLDWLHDSQPVSMEVLTAQLDKMVTAEFAGIKLKKLAEKGETSEQYVASTV